jgi:hypothetical protein
MKLLVTRDTPSHEICFNQHSIFGAGVWPFSSPLSVGPSNLMWRCNFVTSATLVPPELCFDSIQFTHQALTHECKRIKRERHKEGNYRTFITEEDGDSLFVAVGFSQKKESESVNDHDRVQWSSSFQFVFGVCLSDGTRDKVQCRTTTIQSRL